MQRINKDKRWRSLVHSVVSPKGRLQISQSLQNYLGQTTSGLKIGC